MQVFITGMGIVSAAGGGVQETQRALKSGETGIRKISLLSQPGVDALAGEVRMDNKTLKEKLNVQPEAQISRTSLLGAYAGREALGRFPNELKSSLPFITGTTVGGMDLSETFYRNYLVDETNRDFKNLLTHDCGSSSGKIAALLGIQGFISTISTACSSSANAILLAGKMLRSGRYKRALAGGADALTHFTLSGFRSLMIYDKEPCKPFDNNRAGLNLGEGAAYLLLETESSLKETGGKPLAILSGWGNANDAYHQTASSPEGEGATLAMSIALSSAGIQPEAINYVNAHGTATPNNDLSESKALRNIFGENVPPFSSTKSITGHTLAASGAIEAVFSVLSLQQGALLPNVHFQNAIKETRLTPVLHYQAGKDIRFVMSNSFGFGGNNTSLVIQKA